MAGQPTARRFGQNETYLDHDWLAFSIVDVSEGKLSSFVCRNSNLGTINIWNLLQWDWIAY